MASKFNPASMSAEDNTSNDRALRNESTTFSTSPTRPSMFLPSKKSFEDIDDSSDSRLLPTPNNNFPVYSTATLKPRFKLFVFFAFSTMIILLLFLVVLIGTLIYQLRHPSPFSPITATSWISPLNTLHCGTSPSQARELDCVFDIMDYSFVPRPCYHTSLSQKYISSLLSHNITFYRDASLTQVLPTAEILAAKHEYVFTQRILHTKHCEYYLYRQTRVLLDGLATSLMRNASYGLHCLEEVRNPGAVGEKMFMGFHYEKCAMGLGHLTPSARRRPNGDLGKIVDGGAGNALKLPPV